MAVAYSHRARGLRGRFAARQGDLATAKADLEKIKDDRMEHGALDAVLKLNRGDYAGSVAAFVALAGKEGSPMPRDVLFDFPLAVECTGDEANASEAYRTLEAFPTPPEAQNAAQEILSGILGELLAGAEWRRVREAKGAPPTRKDLALGILDRSVATEKDKA